MLPPSGIAKIRLCQVYFNAVLVNSRSCGENMEVQKVVHEWLPTVAFSWHPFSTLSHNWVAPLQFTKGRIRSHHSKAQFIAALFYNVLSSAQFSMWNYVHAPVSLLTLVPSCQFYVNCEVEHTTF